MDLSTAWAAPYTNRLLGALGADVIKVESISYYDVWRGPVDPPPGGLGEYADNDPGTHSYERTPLFGTCNRNKRGISLDLSRPQGREVFIRLLKEVVLVSHSPLSQMPLGSCRTTARLLSAFSIRWNRALSSRDGRIREH